MGRQDDNTAQRLAQLRVAAERACAAAVAVGGALTATADRERLRCTEVGIAHWEGAEPTHVVTLSPAAPNAYRLRDYVHNRLATAGWRNVVVETEW